VFVFERGDVNIFQPIQNYKIRILADDLFIDDFHSIGDIVGRDAAPKIENGLRMMLKANPKAQHVNLGLVRRTPRRRARWYESEWPTRSMPHSSGVDTINVARY
jgi:hypothetical protein